MPVPSHVGHSIFMNFPVPWHFGQVVVVENNPKGVLCVLLTTPWPPHSGQSIMSSDVFAPVPPQVGQVSFFGMIISFSTPKAASSSVISISYLRSEPLCALLPLLPPNEPPPPKNLSNISPKSKDAKSESPKPKSEESKPLKPDACLYESASPNWSYCLRFSSSPRTWAASFISLNLSDASACLFISG